MRFFNSSRGSEIFAGVQPPNPPSNTALPAARSQKNLPGSQAQAFRPQTLPFRAVISQSRLTRPPPQSPTELAPLQAVRSRTHARTQSPAHRPTDRHSVTAASSTGLTGTWRARAASSHSEIRRQINQCVRVPCFQAHFLRISYEPFRRTNQRLFKFSSPFFRSFCSFTYIPRAFNANA